jgi:hypothetical protein
MRTLGVTLVLVACGKGGGSAAVDHTRPEAVVQAIFDAAATGDTDKLAGLCPPTGEGDGDVKKICAAKKGEGDWDSFQQHFAKGKLKGDARVQDHQAEVDFTFGPAGNREETMRLGHRDGKWYLMSF